MTCRTLEYSYSLLDWKAPTAYWKVYGEDRHILAKHMTNGGLTWVARVTPISGQNYLNIANCVILYCSHCAVYLLQVDTNSYLFASLHWLWIWSHNMNNYFCFLFEPLTSKRWITLLYSLPLCKDEAKISLIWMLPFCTTHISMIRTIYKQEKLSLGKKNIHTVYIFSLNCLYNLNPVWCACSQGV